MTPDAIATLMSRAYVWQTPWSAAAVTDTLNLPTTRLWSEPGSVLIMQVIAGEGEILALATDPDCQRNGLARKVLTTAHVALQSQSVTRILLDVAAPNAPARALYGAMGYVQVGLRPRYYPQPGADPADAVVMARDLP